jgi:NAD-dependent dihydropyrimidine dehydrogenase PreA subunit
MSFEFDPTDIPELPELDKIDRQETPAGQKVDKRIPVKIDLDLCENTGVCAELCPEDVLECSNGATHVIRPQACTECWICVENCIASAIEIV